MELKYPPVGVKFLNYSRFLDDRGSFFRVLELRGNVSQELDVSLASNDLKHTLRGFHYNKNITLENKYVTVLTGSIFDVLVDLRPEQESYLDWYGFTFSAEQESTMHVPPGIAHGYLTLEDKTTVSYVMDCAFEVGDYGRIRWNDPCLEVRWPFEPQVISPQDRFADLLQTQK